MTLSRTVYQLSTPPISDAGQQMELLSYTGNKAFNVSKGVQYASTHATKINSRHYYEFKGKDCTNFVSQIKKAGGVKEYTDWSAGVNPFLCKSFSWYYENKNDYGAIWVNANKFVKFFGVKYTTKNFYTFSLKVRKGSFIALDKDGDGDYNHNAFVTATTRPCL